VGPFPAAARESHDVLVVEVSSFQLATQTSFHPKVSVLLNLAPDHLDWHGSVDGHVGGEARGSGRSRTAPSGVRWFPLGGPSEGGAAIRDGRLTAGWSGADLGARSFDSPPIRA